ncbi:hypothetical protein HD554DRAFT_1266864 [Boletus coccyginus]|nr:hypothetical protein HD554DRAFT_1266864 [Boletus coccyginus]
MFIYKQSWYQARFATDLKPSALHFVFLKLRGLIDGSRWPRFTILGQSLGSMYLLWEAISRFIPDLYIDSMGYTFTFLVVAWPTRTSVPIGSYVYYPSISTDVLARVQGESRKMRAKRLYYCHTMNCYALSLAFSVLDGQLVMATGPHCTHYFTRTLRFSGRTE